MKKFSISLLCLSLFLLLTVFASAAGTVNQEEIFDVLSLLEIMNGDENGNLNLEKPVTRAEFAKLAISASSYQELGASTGGVSPFSDVPHTHWAAGYVTTARNAGYLAGYLDGTFRPTNSVTLAEAVTVLEKLLGYTDDSFIGVWPSGQMSLCRSLKLNDQVTAGTSDAISREDCAHLIYNTLNARTRSGSVYAQSLGYTLDALERIDYLSLINQKLDGPYLVTGESWQAAIGFQPERIYRNDTLVTSVQKHDVLYYSKIMKTVYAFHNTVSGRIDAIAPNRVSPMSVTISGATYALGGGTAAYQLSNLGSYRVSDSVILLLGRDGSALYLLTPESEQSVRYGVVTAVGRMPTADSNNQTYSTAYADVTLSDGISQRFEISTEKDMKAGYLVCVSTLSEGVTVTRVTESRAAGGVVSPDGSLLGKVRFADDVEILDVSESRAMTISKKRIAGVTLSSADISVCAENKAGEIAVLILKNVTGDLDSYGIMTNARVADAGASFYATYTYIQNGTVMNYASSKQSFPVRIGAISISSDASGITMMRNLTAQTIDALDTITARSGVRHFTLGDGVQIYEQRDGTYYLSNRAAVSDSDVYKLTAYLDKAESEGGRVRVVIAQKLNS